ALFARSIGVIFSAMYNTFLDAGILKTIDDVARRLAASAASPGDWVSTELGKIIRFADDRSREHLKHGTMDPFPLLRAGEGSFEQRGPCNLVNPLLFVTERKGLAYCLHYGAFPLNAFHSDVVWWKMRPKHLQDEYGKAAPRVTRHQEVNAFIGKNGPTATPIPGRVVKEAWLGSALEQLAQMCGAFLRVTAIRLAESKTSHLTINIQAGDALDFCDALVAMPQVVEPVGRSSHDDPDCSSRPRQSGNPSFAFQQGSLQPLQLCAELFNGSRPDFDIISTSNLADHLGVVNLLVATVPLLKRLPDAVLLTSMMASLEYLHTYKDTSEFFQKIMCLSPQAASILL
ncbi:unnamed protein product, partial [Hapterophycus canaliculatus]